jgi:Outer membrane protein beta-barrel domain
MRLIARWKLLTAIFAALSSGTVAMAQAADATASERFRLSAFGGMTGIYTDVFGGRNLAFTAGADLSLRRFLGVNPSAEFRGTIPFISGEIAGQRSLLGGVKLERKYGIFHPYGTILFGRGAIEFQNGGLHAGPFTYIRTTSTVYSPGVGVDIDWTHKWAVKADFQYQFWTTFPPYPGVPNPIVLTGGVMYRFDFNRRYGKPKQQPVITGEPPRPATPR